MHWEQTILVALVGVMLLMYIWMHMRQPSRCQDNRCRSPAYDPCDTPTYYTEPYTGINGNELNPQDVIQFSDVMVTEKQRIESNKVKEDSQEIQTIDERFNAAKRSAFENKMRAGIHSSKDRRKLIDNLLRRPHCSRRVRSWRTENSDILRGDIRPKPGSASTNLLQSASAKKNPDADLHPGALGPMAGRAGLWLSEDMVPDNVFLDAEEDHYGTV